ncbi:imidazolonepropionase [Athalassotoga sp.]|uniref:imidazolonepropionase n=1 Tax=Athalassotoga sp. TaxID=2022597 RepID=UPI003D06C779
MTNSANLEIRNVKIVTATGISPVTDCVLKYVTGNIKILDGKIISISNEPSESENVFEGDGMLAIPGFVDPHTHIPFVGDRTKEFLMRAKGAKYSEILKDGGGIHSTVDSVRKASLDDLVVHGLKYARWFLKSGVTAIECKSGYGLDFENEIKQLEAIRRISENTPQKVVSTFLGAHAVPSMGEKAYIDELKYMLDFVKEKDLAKFVDIFCDEGAFSVEGSVKYIKYAKSKGFKVRVHADELSSNGFAGIASDLGAASVDHLAMCSKAEIKKMAQNKTMAVLLPLTSFYLKNAFAPARAMIDEGVPVALGSDFNPGSNTFYSPFLNIHLAVNYLGMTPEEAFVAHTLNAASVLGLEKECGTIEVGKRADIVIIDAPDIDYIPYMPSGELLKAVFVNGVEFFENRDNFSRKD